MTKYAMLDKVQIRYKFLTNKLNQHDYKAGLIIAKMQQFNQNLKIVKINKAAASGTKITFQLMQSPDEVEQERQELYKLDDEFAKEFGKNVIERKAAE